MATAPKVRGEPASSINAWNFSSGDGGCADGASGKDFCVVNAWRRSRGTFEPSKRNPWGTSAEGPGLWHNAPQTVNSRKEMIRLNTFSFTIPTYHDPTSDTGAPR